MLKDPRNLLWIIPLGALLTVPLWKPFAAGFLNPMRQTAGQSMPALTNLRPPSSSEMTGVQFEQTRNGDQEWLLNAARFYSLENDAKMRFEDVHAWFFGDAREHEETRIRSREALYNRATRQITLQGEVLIENEQGYEMRTDSLEYLADDKKISTTSAVLIQGGNIEVRGNRLLYDIATGNYTLAGNVVFKIR